MASNDDMLTQLLVKQGDLYAGMDTIVSGQVMLLAGSIDDPDSFNKDGGKTGALGYYPIVDVNGRTTYRPCQARIEATALGQSNPETVETIVAASGAAVSAAVTASDAAGVAQGMANFRASLLEGVATFPVGAYFSSAETGVTRVYKRIVAAPGYEDQGDAAAPVNRGFIAATPEMFGAVSGEDGTDALQALVDSYGASTPTAVVGTYSTPKVRLKAGATYYVRRSITIPHHISIDWGGARILPHPAAKIEDFWPHDGTRGYMFLLGCDAQGRQLMGNQGTVLPKISGGLLHNLKRAPAPSAGYVPILAGLKAFWHQSRHAIEDMTIQGFYGAVTKQNTGIGDVYTDMLAFQRLEISSAKGSDWMLDIAYHGDNLVIDQITSTQLPENRNLLRVDRCRGGRIDGIINSNVLIQRSDGIRYTGFHHETGYIETQGSSVTLADGHIWHRESTQRYVDPAGVDKGFCAPIRHLPYLNADVPARHLTMRNVRFVNVDHSHNANDMQVGYSDQDFPDLYIDQFATAEITGCYRSYEPAGVPGATSDSGILVSRNSSSTGALWPEWTALSAYASKHSVLSAGEITVLPVTTTIAAGYTQATAANVSSRGIWSAPSGTYYYCEVVLNGPSDRLLATVGPEKSVALVQGGGAPMWTYTERAVDFPGFSNMTRRIYRGTQPGVYDRYVDLPCFRGQRWYDTGYWEGSGYRWKARQAVSVRCSPPC